MSLVFGGATNADGTAEYRSVPIYKELGKDLTKLAEVWRIKSLKRALPSKLREYDCAPQPDDPQHVQFIDVTEDKHLAKALAALANGTDLTEWTSADPKAGKPRSFMIQATLSNGNRVRLFGRITSGKQLTGPGKLVAFLEGQRFRALEEQKAILLEARFDCAEVEDYLFILRPTGFESLFAYETSLAETAQKTIKALEAFLDTANAAALRAGVGTNRNLLRQIAGRIRLDLKTADPERVQAAITKCRFNVTIDVIDGKLKLGFAGNDPQDLIRLLTERGVESIVSGTPYIATALESVRS